MSDILDEPIEKDRLNKFTDAAYSRCKKASLFFVLMILLLIFDLNFPISIPDFLVGSFLLIILFQAILGFVSSIKSILHKEENNIKKFLIFLKMYCKVLLVLFLDEKNQKSPLYILLNATKV